MKQAQSIQWTPSLFMPVWSCHFPSNTKYSVLCQGLSNLFVLRPHFEKYFSMWPPWWIA